MADTAQFPYTRLIDPTGTPLLRPILTVGFASSHKRIIADALIDSGADANILPYQLGLELDADWRTARPVPPVSGNRSML